MRALYYRRSSLVHARAEEQPGQSWRGVTLLPKFGIEVIYNEGGPIRDARDRIAQNLSNLKKFYFGRERYDIVYTATHGGLELLVLLRALGLFRKPVAIYRYSSIAKSSGPLGRAFLRLFYKGIDVIMISSRLSCEESKAARIVPPEKIVYVRIGPDLPYYDALMDRPKPDPERETPFTFISTGREGRDFRTLLSAFAATDKKLVLYTTYRHGAQDHRSFFASAGPWPDNIEVHLLEKALPPLPLARMVAEADCVVCPLNEPGYDTGTSTLREAAALGKPVIVTKNAYFDFDVEKEGMGLKVGVGDVEGWVRAIEQLASDRKAAVRMGGNARAYTEREWNLEGAAEQIAGILFDLEARGKRRQGRPFFM